MQDRFLDCTWESPRAQQRTEFSTRCRVRWFPWPEFRRDRPSSPHGCGRWWSYWYRAQVSSPIPPPPSPFLIHSYSGELHDFLEEDLKFWYPELASRMKITLVEALPSVLPMFSKALIDYTESTFKKAKIDILTKTMVKEIKEKSVILQMPDKSIQ